MDLKQLEYIVQIAEENNITRAAEKQFITQSALNQQLLKLEKELGTPLFYRSRTDWRPTEAGEVYIRNAKEILRIKRETYSMINDIVETKRGNLSVGFTPGRGIPMFTKVYPSFHQIYPGIVVLPLEMSVKKQQELIAHGDLDIGFMTLLDKQRTNDCYINICNEDIVLAIPESYPQVEQLRTSSTELDISQFENNPFVLMYKESSLRTLIDELFKQANFTPKVLFETSNIPAIVTMIKSGLCCSIIPRYYVKNNMDGMNCFYLPNHPTWTITASYRKDSYLSHAAKYFIQLAANFWTK